MFPALLCPEVHDLECHGISFIVSAVFGGLVLGLQNHMTLPVVVEHLDELCHRTLSLVKDQVFDGKRRIHGRGKGEFCSSLVISRPCSAQPLIMQDMYGVGAYSAMTRSYPRPYQGVFPVCSYADEHSAWTLI